MLEKLPPTMVAAMLSEEGSEASNKDLKYIELNHTFHGDDLTVLTQTYYRMMERSDPVMQAYSLEKRIQQRKKKDIPPEVLALLRPYDDDLFYTYSLCFEPDSDADMEE